MVWVHGASITEVKLDQQTPWDPGEQSGNEHQHADVRPRENGPGLVQAPFGNFLMELLTVAMAPLPVIPIPVSPGRT